MESSVAEAQMRNAHTEMGGFIARCSLLDYRISQFMARWFCTHEKQKFLSYTLRAMPFTQKRQVIEERLTNWHKSPDALKETMAEISKVLERRDLVASGVLSRRSGGNICIKSFSGAQYISEEGAIDIIDIDDLPGWSERATELSDRLFSLGMDLQERPKD
jgi:hypothetical protein